MVEKTLNDRFDLSLSEYSTLEALVQTPGKEGMRMLALAEAIGLNQSSVSRLVARLERQGFVQRSLYEKDRCGVFTSITEAGREVLAAAVGSATITPRGWWSPERAAAAPATEPRP